MLATHIFKAILCSSSPFFLLFSSSVVVVLLELFQCFLDFFFLGFEFFQLCFEDPFLFLFGEAGWRCGCSSLPRCPAEASKASAKESSAKESSAESSPGAEARAAGSESSAGEWAAPEWSCSVSKWHVVFTSTAIKIR